jgi:hypothetical protein
LDGPLFLSGAFSGGALEAIAPALFDPSCGHAELPPVELSEPFCEELRILENSARYSGS